MSSLHFADTRMMKTIRFSPAERFRCRRSSLPVVGCSVNAVRIFDSTSSLNRKRFARNDDNANSARITPLHDDEQYCYPAKEGCGASSLLDGGQLHRCATGVTPRSEKQSFDVSNKVCHVVVIVFARSPRQHICNGITNWNNGQAECQSKAKRKSTTTT